LKTIASLGRCDPVTAVRAVVDLWELFRAALGAGQGDSTLAEEIHLAERYLAI
jgi:two-component system sensor histidine kinase AlgZ